MNHFCTSASILVLSTALLAGCGGGGDAPSQPSASPDSGQDSVNPDSSSPDSSDRADSSDTDTGPSQAEVSAADAPAAVASDGVGIAVAVTEHVQAIVNTVDALEEQIEAVGNFSGGSTIALSCANGGEFGLNRFTDFNNNGELDEGDLISFDADACQGAPGLPVLTGVQLEYAPDMSVFATGFVSTEASPVTLTFDLAVTPAGGGALSVSTPDISGLEPVTIRASGEDSAAVMVDQIDATLPGNGLSGIDFDAGSVRYVGGSFAAEAESEFAESAIATVSPLDIDLDIDPMMGALAAGELQLANDAGRVVNLTPAADVANVRVRDDADGDGTFDTDNISVPQGEVVHRLSE